MQPWWVTHLLEFITNTAWPIVVLVIFLSIREQLLFLVSKLDTFGGFGFHLTFNKALDEVENEIESISKNNLTNADDDSSAARIRVIDKWNEFEKEIRDSLADKISLKTTSGNKVFSSNVPFGLLVDYLRKNNILSNEEIKIVLSLQSLRNQVVHSGKESISTLALDRYLLSLSVMEQSIKARLLPLAESAP